LKVPKLDEDIMCYIVKITTGENHTLSKIPLRSILELLTLCIVYFKSSKMNTSNVSQNVTQNIDRTKKSHVTSMAINKSGDVTSQMSE